jgi:hypothetical protein
VQRLKSEVERYKKIACDQQDLISNYEGAINGQNMDVTDNHSMEKSLNNDDEETNLYAYLKNSKLGACKSSAFSNKKNRRSSIEILEEKFNASKSFKDRFFNPNKLMKPESSHHQKLHSLQHDPEIEDKFIQAMEKLKLTDSMNMTLKEELNSITDHNDTLIDENHLLKSKLKKYHTKYQDLNEENQRLIDNFAKIEEELNQMTSRHLKSPKYSNSEK